MKKKALHVLRFIVLLAVGVLLIYLSVRSIPLHDMRVELERGNYWICIPVYLVSLAGYVCRVERWGQMYETVGKKPGRGNMFMSLCIGYLVSFVVPRLGEAVRCVLVKRAERIPLSTSVLTIVAERLLDTVCLFVVLAAALLVHMETAGQFVADRVAAPVLDAIRTSSGSLWIAAGVLLLIAGLLFALRYVRHRLADAAGRTIRQFIRGMRHMRQKGKFVVLTVLIWFCYFLMTYLWFFVFDESSSLGLKEALFVMAIGSIGRSIPIQGGGMGAYHFLVSQALALFGISLLTGNALAIVIHGAQTVLVFFSGAICYAWFLFSSKRKNFAGE